MEGAGESFHKRPSSLKRRQPLATRVSTGGFRNTRELGRTNVVERRLVELTPTRILRQPA